ncbi:c-type cytochrome [Novosphingobium flavum]|uniref:C-type cytochrome n=1 Tax=Novosphingobium aerophilum TaxID=2839843 RepID=A0A7X1KDK0_9SPHN|nr:c-type cytochrome [Novosphingobium aerophilum]MBC2653421.1 c-type cytochrome [Novosphingobium aerophilum]MBC2661888.1 c-type cytochrome [Novosphingobium aerophilum]
MKALTLATGLAALGLTTLGLAAPAFAAPPAPAAPPPVFARCAVCHNATKGAGAKIGPDLWGVYGGKAARANFKYSQALKNAKLKWDDATLDKWLTAPMAMVPGTIMSFPGLKDPAKRAEIIAYLKTLR